jgi:hypothetical protein
VSDEWQLLGSNSIGYIAFGFVSRLDESEVFLSVPFTPNGHLACIAGGKK